jgi:hypothetical protein
MRILVSALVNLLLLSVHAAQTVTNVDLINAAINDRPISELTADSVADMLGRPTAIKQPEILAVAGEKVALGARLVYADLGLTFRLRHEQNDSKQRVASVLIYLSRQEDSETRTECSPFRGALSSGVSAEWKAKRVMEDFAQYKPVDFYDNARKKREMDDAWDQMDRLAGRDVIPHANLFLIIVNFPMCCASFHYEEHTKFLESIEVSPRRSQEQSPERVDEP